MKKTVVSLNPLQADDTFDQLSEVQGPTPPVSAPKEQVKQKCIILSTAIPNPGYNLARSPRAPFKVGFQHGVSRSRAVSPIYFLAFQIGPSIIENAHFVNGSNQ